MNGTVKAPKRASTTLMGATPPPDAPGPFGTCRVRHQWPSWPGTTRVCSSSSTSTPSKHSCTFPSVSTSATGPKASCVPFTSTTAIAHQLRELEVVRRDEHGDSLRLQRAQGVDEGVPVLLVEAVERLVEQQQARLGGERPGQEAALPLAARELAEPALGDRPEADRVERPAHRRAVGAAGPAQEPEAPVAALHHDLLEADREVGIELGGLRQESDHAVASMHARRSTALCVGRRCRGIRRRRAEGHPARRERHEPEHAREQRGLAGAVRADERDRLTGADLEVEPRHPGAPRVGERGAVEAQHGRVGHPVILAAAAGAGKA